MLFNKLASTFLISILVSTVGMCIAQERARDYGIEIGILHPGRYNAITDVGNVRVGHFTLIQSDSIRTGVTAILPHSENIFQNKVPAAIHLANGFGKLAGYAQVAELGVMETPIVLSNTLNVSAGLDALIDYTFRFDDNHDIRSVNGLVGETNDGWLNDIRGRHLNKSHFLTAIDSATQGPVEEGSVGAGTGTSCLGFKGGIGTSSRKIPQKVGGWTVGVLVQSNFGGILQIDGVPVGEELGIHKFRNVEDLYKEDGSCMIIVATDAPLDARNLERLAKRAMFGLARTGGIASNGSGDFVIAFSTFTGNQIPYEVSADLLELTILQNEKMDYLFEAVIEATEEAIINSLFRARSIAGYQGHQRHPLPIKDVLNIMKAYGRLKN